MPKEAGAVSEAGMHERPVYHTAGDRALVVELGEGISPGINSKVRDLLVAMEHQQIPGVIDLVPSYRSILVQYDPIRILYDELTARIGDLESALDSGTIEKPAIVEIPTLYGHDEYGPDLEFVARHTRLDPDDVVRIHSGADYRVDMMGFSPGFPYLGGLSDRLTTPRLATPRAQIPAGSVGIAESQTGVYPVASPGGWRLIGRTPLKLFDAGRRPPAMLNAGDSVRFTPIESKEAFADIRREVEAGDYRNAAKEAS